MVHERSSRWSTRGAGRSAWPGRRRRRARLWWSRRRERRRAATRRRCRSILVVALKREKRNTVKSASVHGSRTRITKLHFITCMIVERSEVVSDTYLWRILKSARVRAQNDWSAAGPSRCCRGSSRRWRGRGARRPFHPGSEWAATRWRRRGGQGLLFVEGAQEKIENTNLKGCKDSRRRERVTLTQKTQKAFILLKRKASRGGKQAVDLVLAYFAQPWLNVVYKMCIVKHVPVATVIAEASQAAVWHREEVPETRSGARWEDPWAWVPRGQAARRMGAH